MAEASRSIRIACNRNSIRRRNARRQIPLSTVCPDSLVPKDTTIAVHTDSKEIERHSGKSRAREEWFYRLALAACGSGQMSSDATRRDLRQWCADNLQALPGHASIGHSARYSVECSDNRRSDADTGTIAKYIQSLVH